MIDGAIPSYQEVKMSKKTLMQELEEEDKKLRRMMDSYSLGRLI